MAEYIEKKYHIPKEIEVNGMSIEIIMEEELLRRKDSSGQFDPMKMKIYIDPALCPAQQKVTLVHEVIEAINHLYDMDLEHHKICLLEAALFGLGFLQG